MSMGGSHGDDDHGGDKKAPGGGNRHFMVDRFFSRIVDYVTGGIAKLIAFIFIMITVGALIGYFIASKQWPFLLVFIPAALGVVAYYERDVAIILFAALLLFVVL